MRNTTCRHCNRAIDVQNRYCPQCGKEGQFSSQTACGNEVPQASGTCAPAVKNSRYWRREIAFWAFATLLLTSLVLNVMWWFRLFVAPKLPSDSLARTQDTWSYVGAVFVLAYLIASFMVARRMFSHAENAVGP